MTWNTTQTIGALSGLPTPLNGSAMNSIEGCITVSDRNGQLLFYSDGISIWNRNHGEMTTGLTGGVIGNNIVNFYASQSATVMPHPGNANQYIVLTIGINGDNDLAYTVVDMTLNGGLGGVTQKNIPLTGAKGTLGENVTTVKHANGTDYWIVATGKGSGANSALNVWKVTSVGVQASLYNYAILPANTDPSYTINGYLRFSLDGKYFAWAEALNFQYAPGYNRDFFFGEFDPSTGVFSNIKAMATPSSSQEMSCYGVEFSPSGKILYISSSLGDQSVLLVYRFEDLLASSNPGGLSHKKITNPASRSVQALQLGPDGRIYGAAQGSQSLLVIDNVEDYNNYTYAEVTGLIPSGTYVQYGLPAFPSEWLLALFPEARPDTATVIAGSTCIVDILANDKLGDCDRSSIQVSIETPAASGTPVSFAWKDLVYKPLDGFSGIDSLTYKITCGTLSRTAKVYITVYDNPGNINDAKCYDTPSAMEWGIKVDWSSANIVSVFNTPFVGDLNNDQIPEIVCFGDAGRTGSDPTGIKLNTILIYDGQTHNLVNTISMKNASNANIYVTGYDASAYGLVKRPSDKKGLVVVACTDYYLRAYDIAGTLIWTSDQPYASGTNGEEYAVNIGFADFNQDGNPELYLRNQIYDASTGKWLATATGGSNLGAAWAHYSQQLNHKLSSPIAADVLGDSRLELILGNEIYEVNIGANGNTVQMIKSVTPPTGAVSDGFAQVADFNMDGHLDIFIATRSSKDNDGTVAGYVWDVFNHVTGTPFTISTSNSGLSIPLIADINNDGLLEVLIQSGVNGSVNKYQCYKYDPATKAFSLLWGFAPDENSFSNSATLFDFNMDGMNEILLSDQTKIRILNGSGKSHITKQDTLAVYVMAEISFGEVTIMQYPVIADVDADGHAEIVVVGNPNGVSNSLDGSVNILKASNNASLWAPARKVWNQYMYNAVNINEDLTVPRCPLNPATVFPGNDGQIGTVNDVRPYNNFLQQQTSLTTNGLPYWPMPDVQILSTKYDLHHHIDGDSLCIFVKLTNSGDVATLAPFHITAYRNAVTPGNIMTVDSLMQPIFPGDTLTTVVIVHNFSTFRPLDTVVVRLNDSGYGYEQAECGDNIKNESVDPNSRILGVFDDVQTVQVFQYVEIDALANDNLPSGYFTPGFSLLDSVTLLPVNGHLRVSGTGGSSKFVYVNLGTDKLTAQIDSFRYRFTFYHTDLQEWRTDSAMVYIYILEDKNGASVCYNTAFTVRLAERPAGVTFDWYTPDGQSDGSGSIRSLPPMPADSVWLICPYVPDAAARWNLAGGFPKGPFNIHVSGATPALMRWTGVAGHDWHNPGNWVEIRTTSTGTYETPVSWLPSACTDVEIPDIPSDIPYYPELRDSAVCKEITIRDRAMLGNPHALNYTSARVEILLNSLERDRFVMWSAPLKHMYSGDYHFKDALGIPRWGDVKMNFFQQDNPDGGTATADMLTATFGAPEKPLPLGTAFNLKVMSTSESRDRVWRFPQTDPDYDPNFPLLKRDSSDRFITDGVTLTGSPATFDLPVRGGDLAQQHMIQVVNPYLAYLDVSRFLEGNKMELADGYLIWNGRVEEGFEAVKFTDGIQYLYTGFNVTSVTPEYIPPLQSFFVVKEHIPTVTSVKMSPAWTTTSPPNLNGAYQLRSAATAEEGVLRIRASQGNRTSYAVLHFDRNASPEYNSREDVRALFYDENPLTVYALTPLREPLAIHANGDFQSQTTGLGLRVRNAGEMTLTFSGMERFGHDIYLLDREKNQTVNLSEKPDYTFTVVKPSITTAVEINDRFALQMHYTGVWNEPAAVRTEALTALSRNGEIHVRSTGSLIRELQVYNIAGALVYATAVAATEYRIPAERGGTYIVRAKFNDTTETKKVTIRD
ncbi:MAG: FG-GAP-like repeat-containing protein [Tannerella sp.]|nr:FG-GAP-like repeat-containing protein [Tannerella sp.]